MTFERERKLDLRVKPASSHSRGVIANNNQGLETSREPGAGGSFLLQMRIGQSIIGKLCGCPHFPLRKKRFFRRLESTDVIQAPREQVYLVVRDKLPDLAAYLPNVQRVETLNYSQQDKKTEIENRWFANAKVPKLVESVLSDELFSWNDRATWFNEDYRVQYRLESALAKEIFDARGENFFVDRGGKETELRVTCEVSIHADKIPGIPRLLSRRVVPIVEALLEKMLKPNLLSLSSGLKEYFKDR